MQTKKNNAPKHEPAFQVGDMVYAEDWCYGQIVDIDEDSAIVEFETAEGGGTWSFELDQLRHAES